MSKNCSTDTMLQPLCCGFSSLGLKVSIQRSSLKVFMDPAREMHMDHLLVEPCARV